MKTKTRVQFAHLSRHVQYLAHFIESHPPARFHGVDSHGNLICSTEFYDSETEECTRESDTVIPTIQGVRNWLGY